MQVGGGAMRLDCGIESYVCVLEFDFFFFLFSDHAVALNEVNLTENKLRVM